MNINYEKIIRDQSDFFGLAMSERFGIKSGGRINPAFF